MNHISELRQLGTSTWLDDLSRERLVSGNLKEIISAKSIVGVTTNPAIFAAAMTNGTAYAAEAGKDVSTIHSVASFFVSRLDTEVDKRLEAIGSESALALRGKAGVANAQRAYALFQDALLNDADLPEGAHLQRPLWASTGVKNPEYPATLYVSELAGPHTVNTMPEKTIDAVLSEGNLHGDALSDSREAAEGVFAQLEEVGIDFDDVFAVLEREGVDKFVAAWEELLASIKERLA